MKTRMIAFLLVTPIVAHAEATRLRGFDAVNQILTDRLADARHPLDVRSYFSANGNALGEHLGAYPDNGGAIEAVQPNSVSMLLWQAVLHGLSADLQKKCSSTGRLFVQPGFLAALKKVCRWPAAEAQTKQAMMDLWLSVMGYDAPPGEFEAWRKFFLSSSYKKKAARETVEAMLFSMMYNPHFLLQK